MPSHRNQKSFQNHLAISNLDPCSCILHLDSWSCVDLYWQKKMLENLFTFDLGKLFHNYRRNSVFRVFLLFQENWYTSLLPTFATNNCLFNIIPHFCKLVYPCDITKVGKSCCTCCQDKCFPIFQETCLDPESPFELIQWPQHEVEVDHNVELRNDVKKRFLEATISRF